MRGRGLDLAVAATSFAGALLVGLTFLDTARVDLEVLQSIAPCLDVTKKQFGVTQYHGGLFGSKAQSSAVSPLLGYSDYQVISCSVEGFCVMVEKRMGMSGHSPTANPAGVTRR